MSEAIGLPLGTLAEACGGRLADPAKMKKKRIFRVASVREAGPDAVTWVVDEEHARAAQESTAAAIVGTQRYVGTHPRGLIVEDPQRAIVQILELFFTPLEQPLPGIHPSAIVHETAKLGPGVAVGALAVIHAGAEIGSDSIIHEGVSIGARVRVGRNSIIYDRCVLYDRCSIGDRVILHAGVVIGADGFGYIFRDGRHHRIPHVGTVVIEDEVEIGPNTCIDRAKTGATKIGRGSKIDNLVMIAHNVEVGPMCIITAQCGLSGSARLGKGVIMGGQSGLPDGVELGDGVRLATRAIPWTDAPAGVTLSGFPAQDHRKELRERSRIRKLPRLFERMSKLEKRLAELETATHHPDDC